MGTVGLLKKSICVEEPVELQKNMSEKRGLTPFRQFGKVSVPAFRGLCGYNNDFFNSPTVTIYIG